MVIATGLADRQIAAMAEHLSEKLHQAGLKRVQVEGAGGADWVLIDAGDIVVHLFKPEARAMYALEKMWGAELDEASSRLIGATVRRFHLRHEAGCRGERGFDREVLHQRAGRKHRGGTDAGRRVFLRRRRAEQAERRRAGCGGQMHQAGIVADEQRAAGEAGGRPPAG